MSNPSLVRFRQDLCLADDPAPVAAPGGGGPLVALYLRDPAGEDGSAPGGAARRWRHHVLVALDAPLRGRGGRLVARSQERAPTPLALARQVGAARVVWSRREAAPVGAVA